MYLLFVDESGDTGHINSNTSHFCLSGLVVHELRWDAVLTAITEFRRGLRTQYDLKVREEIHASEFISKPGQLKRIPKSIRLKILGKFLEFQASIQDISIINVVVVKSANPGRDIFEIAWETLITRFHNTMSHHNFPGPRNPDDRGLIITDQTDEPKLRRLTRKMRRFNHVPSMINQGQSRSVPTITIVEDAVHRSSSHSAFVQLSDVNAYFLRQLFKPNRYIKTQGARHWFNKLGDALCTVASRDRPDGIVVR